MESISAIKLIELLDRRPSDFLALIDGDPRYCIEEVTNQPKSRDESAIMKMARDHVWFRHRFGDIEGVVEADGRLYSQNNDY